MLIYFSLSQTNGPEAPITLCTLGDVCIRLPQKEQGCYSKCNVECDVRTRTAACVVTTMKERWWVFFEMIHLASECRLQKLIVHTSQHTLDVRDHQSSSSAVTQPQVHTLFVYSPLVSYSSRILRKINGGINHTGERRERNRQRDGEGVQRERKASWRRDSEV